MLKKLDHLHYDDASSTINQLRQSMNHKSLSRDKASCLSLYAHNPDLECYEENCDEHRKQPLESIIEGDSEIKSDQDEVTDIRTLQLEIHEELFFHYLSILALLPLRRSDILQMLS